MTELYWILGSGLLMSAIALTGSLTLTLDEQTLHKIILPLVSLAAGTLLLNLASGLAFLAGIALMLLIKVLIT